MSPSHHNPPTPANPPIPTDPAGPDLHTNKLTTAAGAPVADNTNITTAGNRGPAMLQNPWFLEKLAHFDREVIPERRMHAKGSGAFGTFTVTHDISRYTKAKLFSAVGKQTEVFVRFSTVAGERGAADAERDIRGFATKFYTEDGNWDLVGNNTPVFFLRDPLRFPDLNHAVKRDPKTNMRSAQNNWDFWTMLPEAFHQVTITMSDRGLPKSYRNMHGFGSHTFAMVNVDKQRVWVKYHWVCQQPIENLTDEQAAALVGTDRESHQRDLFDAIAAGDFPKWQLNIQVMTEQQAKDHYENPFDITKIWKHGEYPLIPVGVMELNRNPENYYADVEQAAFNPADIVPGLGFSPDKLLQGRLFSYGDAHRYRLGVNHHSIPVNAPRCPYHAYHRDGQMRVDGNYGATTSYQPNEFDQWAQQPEYADPPTELTGLMDAYEPKDDVTDDCFRAAGDLYRLITEDKKAVLVDNTARNIAPCTDNIKYRHAAYCFLADPDYGTRMIKALGLDQDRVIRYSALSHDELMAQTAAEKEEK
ncbi:MAG: catalase [Actinomycetes bacterium]|nr:catalase [Actinomycetes bacterium]